MPLGASYIDYDQVQRMVYTLHAGAEQIAALHSQLDVCVMAIQMKLSDPQISSEAKAQMTELQISIMERSKPLSIQLEQLLDKLAHDLRNAISQYQDADSAASSRFSS